MTKKILIVTTDTATNAGWRRFLELNEIQGAQYYLLVECYETIPIQITNNLVKGTFLISSLDANEEVDAAIQQCKKWGPFDYILHTDEFSVSLAAEIAEQFSHPIKTIDDIIRYRDKVIMKDFLKNIISTPSLYSIEDLRSNASLFPVVIKPRTSAASRGISICLSFDELMAELSSRNLNLNHDAKRFIEREGDIADVAVEKYIEGDVYHIDGLVFEQQIRYCQASQYLISCLDYTLGKPLVGRNVLDANEQLLWLEFASKTHEALRLPDGAFHLEAFKTPSGDRVFLEIAIRPGGDPISHAILLGQKVDLMLEHIRCQLGIRPNLKGREPLNYGYVLFPKDSSDETPKTVTQVNMPSYTFESLVFSKIPKVGDSIQGRLSYLNNLGYFIFVHRDYDCVVRDMEILMNTYKTHIQ